VASNEYPSIDVTVVAAQRLVPSPIADQVRARYVEEFGDPPTEPGGWFRADDWRRTGFVLDLLEPTERLLDVGAGAGQFVNMLAASGKFGSVGALDRVRYSKYREFHDTIVRFDASVAELPFDDDHFDVVTCMEVLEHVPNDVFLPGIAELRRVCKHQLVMSVPFEEHEPISKGHLRRFQAADIAELFPNGQLTMLDRPRMPWMIIEERPDGSAFSPRAAGRPVHLSTERTTPDQRRIRQLEAELERLRSRRSLRAANALGGFARRTRHRVRTLRPGR
jgi:2-polyprenyl-3-methyl-5-hydroxy-6-metoxy-1,4-benzoquinol methylase